jgi:hypothetical protein
VPSKQPCSNSNWLQAIPKSHPSIWIIHCRSFIPTQCCWYANQPVSKCRSFASIDTTRSDTYAIVQGKTAAIEQMHGHHHDSYKYYEPCLGIIYILLAAVTLASDKAILEDCMCSVHNITQQIGHCQLTNNLNYNNTGIDAYSPSKVFASPSGCQKYSRSSTILMP